MSAVSHVPVALAGRDYEILIGQNLLERLGAEISNRLGVRKLIILTDANVAPLYLKPVEASLRDAGYQPLSLILPSGEDTKNLHRFPDLADRLLGFEPDRKTLLVALGGGVIGDLTGFAAATLLRGVDFVQVPTTLLAQIDSSVGGKTGVNAGAGKNLIGAFHQPRLVLADLQTLTSLPRRELLAGYAEMVKYALLGDAAFFDRLERQGIDKLADPITLAEEIARCCRMKAEIVAEDEREAGRRALLNLGHTFGHALEAETGFGPALNHGEGVAYGMVLAALLSTRLVGLPIGDVDRLRRHLGSAGLPSRLSDIPGAPFSAARLIAHMRHDKKTLNGKLTFIVLEAIGRAATQTAVDEKIVGEILLQESCLA